MRTLTRKGFLKRYLRQVSGLETNNIYTLTYIAYTELARIRYILYAYAKEVGKLEELKKALKKYNFDFTKLTENEDWEKRKLDDVYSYYKNSYENDKRVKALMHNKIIKLKEQKNISNYRIYKDLSLNGSNVNSFLKNGDVSKVSLDTARKMFEYLEKV